MNNRDYNENDTSLNIKSSYRFKHFKKDIFRKKTILIQYTTDNDQSDSSNFLLLIN